MEIIINSTIYNNNNNNFTRDYKRNKYIISCF